MCTSTCLTRRIHRFISELLHMLIVLYYNTVNYILHKHSLFFGTADVPLLTCTIFVHFRLPPVHRQYLLASFVCYVASRYS